MNKLIRIFIAFFVFYTPFFSNAAKVDWGIRKLSYERSLEIAEPVVNIEAVRKLVNGANQTTKVQVPVNASTLGSSVKMLIKGGLASAAIYGIVEGVGWVIDNGVVKKKVGEAENAPTSEYVWILGNSFGLRENPENLDCSSSFSSDLLIKVTNRYIYCANHTYIPDSAKCTGYSTLDTYSCEVTVPHWSGDYVLKQTLKRIKNKDYDPTYKPIYAPVSDTELGDQIIKSPSAPDVIPDVYNPNQTTDTPAKDESVTALDKAIPDSDTDVSTKPNSNKDTDGDGVPDTYDPELPDEGTTTKLPPFCEIAPVMCIWYERYVDDSKKLEEHHEEEKTFWQDVKDWFDWTKEPVDEEPDTEQPEPDTQGIFDKTFDTAFSLSKQCPPDIPYSFNTQYFSGTFNLNMNWLCIIFTALGYPLVFASHCIGMWILYQAVIQREIKW